MMQLMPEFVIFRNDQDNKYYFHLVSSYGKVIALSRGFATKEECRENIAAVMEDSIQAKITDRDLQDAHLDVNADNISLYKMNDIMRKLGTN